MSARWLKPGSHHLEAFQLLFAKSVPRKARRAYTKDATAGLLVGVYTGCVFPFYLIIARDRLHASAFLISVMVAAPFLGNLFALLWANAMEARPKMPFAVTSWVVGRSLFLLMVLAVTPLRFALVVGISQFLVTAAGPAYAAIMKDIYPDEHRGRIMGYARALVALAMIATTFAIAPLLSGLNYRWVFPVGGLFGIVSALVFGTIPTSEPTHEERAAKRPTHEFVFSAFAILRENRGFRWFAASVFTFGFGNLILTPIYPIFQVDRLHISTSQAAMLANTTSIIWMGSYLYWGRYVDVKSPLHATVVNVILTTLIPLNYFLAKNVWMLLPSAVISGITAAGIELAYFNSVLWFAEEGRASHYQALFSWLLGIRGSIAPFVGAALKQAFEGRGWDFRYIFIWAVLIMFAGAVMQIFGVRRDRYNQGA